MNFVLINAGIWLAWWAIWLAIGLLARKNVRRESFGDRAKHLVPLVIGVGMVFSSLVLPALYPLNSSDSFRILALLGTAGGLLFAFVARYYLGVNWSGLVALKDGHALVRSGPYRFIRHPIYAGLVFAMAATALSVNTCGALVGDSLWLVAFLIKLGHEEKILAHAFRGSWFSLCVAVPRRLIPGVFCLMVIVAIACSSGCKYQDVDDPNCCEPAPSGK